MNVKHTDEPDRTQGSERIEAAKAALGQNRFQEAIAAVAPLLDRDDTAQEALYVTAVGHRYLGELDKALATLERLAQSFPTYGRAWQEKGHVLIAAGRSRDAREAYRRAVTLNPALAASWQRIEHLATAAGDGDLAIEARAHVAALSSLAPVLVSVASMIHEGRIYAAEQLCRSYLQANPTDVEGMRLLAQIGLKLNILDDAEFLLESALQFAPDHKLARFDLVSVLHKRQKFQAAFEQAKALNAQNPDNPDFRQVYGNAALTLGHYDEALAIYDDLVQKRADRPDLQMVRGHALKTVGRRDEAIAAYRAAYALRDDFGDAYWSLANLKTYRFTDAELAAMQASADSENTAPVDRYHLCFALGKALEDTKEYSRSFAYYAKGNALKHAETGYSPERVRNEVSRQIDVFDRDYFAAREGYGCAAPDPIFVVGLPRAGSTLLEQILASHSQVDGTLELPNILACAHKLAGKRRQDDGGRYPEIVSELTAEQARQLGETYLEETRVFRKGAPFFVDKMPNNFRHIGLIKTILPNARIIDARRNPLDCCVSGFKQLFAEGQEFTYGLEIIGEYYNDYLRMMRHWDQALPGAILRVIHEDVIDDFEPQVRRILDYCGLEFEQGCLEFHRNKREVRTASSEQVRQPINRKGLGSWQKFADHLGPLRDVLGANIDTYRS